jgi:hypothetical protein
MNINEVKFERGKAIPAAGLNAIVDAVKRALGPETRLKDNATNIYAWLTTSLGDGFYEWREVTFRTDTNVFEALQDGIDSTEAPTGNEGRAFSLTLDDGLPLSSDVFLLVPFQTKTGEAIYAIVGGGGSLSRGTSQGQHYLMITDNAAAWAFPFAHPPP